MGSASSTERDVIVSSLDQKTNKTNLQLAMNQLLGQLIQLDIVSIDSTTDNIKKQDQLCTKIRYQLKNMLRNVNDEYLQKQAYQIAWDVLPVDMQPNADERAVFCRIITDYFEEKIKHINLVHKALADPLLDKPTLMIDRWTKVYSSLPPTLKQESIDKMSILTNRINSYFQKLQHNIEQTLQDMSMSDLKSLVSSTESLIKDATLKICKSTNDVNVFLEDVSTDRASSLTSLSDVTLDACAAK